MFFAYRLGMLPPQWQAQPGMSAIEFVQAARAFIATHHDYAWSIRRGDETQALAFGADTPMGVFIGDAIWAPKVGSRAKVEAAAALIDRLRIDEPVMVQSTFADKRFYERLMDWGILRRVGTTYDASGERLALFQARGN